jgi:hypothetical protein
VAPISYTARSAMNLRRLTGSLLECCTTAKLAALGFGRSRLMWGFARDNDQTAARLGGRKVPIVSLRLCSNAGGPDSDAFTVRPRSVNSWPAPFQSQGCF